MDVVGQFGRLDVSQARGTFVVRTRNSRYFVKADQDPSGFVEWTTDSESVANIRSSGFVGGGIVVGQRLVIRVEAGYLTTSSILSITRAEPGVTLDSLTCPRCQGFKESSTPCKSCGN